MVSPMTKTGIVAAVGITVIVLASTLGWIAVPNIAENIGAPVSSINRALLLPLLTFFL